MRGSLPRAGATLPPGGVGDGASAAHVIGIVWADDAIAWAAWFPTPVPRPAPSLQNVVRISVLRP